MYSPQMGCPKPPTAHTPWSSTLMYHFRVDPTHSQSSSISTIEESSKLLEPEDEPFIYPKYSRAMSLKYNMPESTIIKFEQWGSDYVIVLRVQGHCQLNGVPIFVGLPYGRYVDTPEHTLTLTYYPPFSYGHPEANYTHIVVRSPTPITEDVHTVVTKGCVAVGNTTYDNWREQYGHAINDRHLSTITKVSK
jgi:hypothetical protein